MGIERVKKGRARMFKLIDTKYRIDGRKLQLAREKLGFNQSEFAYACDWTPQYQWRLENDRVETVSEGTKNVIEGVLRELTDRVGTS